MATKTRYAEDVDIRDGRIHVFFLNQNGRELCNDYDSPLIAGKFITSLHHSKKSTYTWHVGDIPEEFIRRTKR